MGDWSQAERDADDRDRQAAYTAACEAAAAAQIAIAAIRASGRDLPALAPATIWGAGP
jgi:hypothetical protein